MYKKGSAGSLDYGEKRSQSPNRENSPDWSRASPRQGRGDRRSPRSPKTPPRGVNTSHSMSPVRGMAKPPGFHKSLSPARTPRPELVHMPFKRLGDHIYPRKYVGAYIPLYPTATNSFNYSLEHSRGYYGHVEQLIDAKTLTTELDFMKEAMDKKKILHYGLVPIGLVVNGIAIGCCLLFSFIFFVVVLIMIDITNATTALFACLAVGSVLVMMVFGCFLGLVLIFYAILRIVGIKGTLQGYLLDLQNKYPALAFEVLEHEARRPGHTRNRLRTYFGVNIRVQAGAEKAMNAGPILKPGGAMSKLPPAVSPGVKTEWVRGGDGCFCSNCGYQAPDNSLPVCPQCQAPNKYEEFCLTCGEKRRKGVKFCPSCGDKYDSTA